MTTQSFGSPRRRQFWSDVYNRGSGRPVIGCPRQCGAYVEGVPVGKLVKWACQRCGYRVHS